MADQTFTDTNTRNTSSGSPSHDFQNAAGGAASSVTDQARSAARDLKDKTIDVASTPTEAIKDQASDFVDAAKDAASHATDKFKETVDGQKNAGAEYVGSLADTMRRAAREFDNELPVAGTYIRKAASQVEHVSGSIRNGNFNDLVRSAQDFAPATHCISGNGRAGWLRYHEVSEELGRNIRKRRVRRNEQPRHERQPHE